MNRQDISFPSGNGRCEGWLYRPAENTPSGPRPRVVLGHGVGGVKEMRLDAYAAAFCDAGYECLVFDYRHFGASAGTPRQLLSITRQLEDWHAAVAFARTFDSTTPSPIILWGSSFGGGLVIDVAAEDGAVAAVISQCPFTDGLASARATGTISSLKVAARALADLVSTAWGRGPVTVALAGPANSAALMTAPDCAPGYAALGQLAPTFRNEVCARFGLAIAGYFPGRRARKVKCPIYVAVCRDDTVAPPARTERLARRAPQPTIHTYPCGHFDIYLGDMFDRAIADYIDFLLTHVPTQRRSVS